MGRSELLPSAGRERHASESMGFKGPWASHCGSSGPLCCCRKGQRRQRVGSASRRTEGNGEIPLKVNSVRASLGTQGIGGDSQWGLCCLRGSVTALYHHHLRRTLTDRGLSPLQTSRVSTSGGGPGGPLSRKLHRLFCCVDGAEEAGLGFGTGICAPGGCPVAHPRHPSPGRLPMPPAGGQLPMPLSGSRAFRPCNITGICSCRFSF